MTGGSLRLCRRPLPGPTVPVDPVLRHSWPAPAKLNLMLRILGRRADGYHRLQTLFQFLDYGDQLSVRVREDGIISRSTPLAGVPADADLVLRAATLLQTASGCRLGADIALEKQIPMGGGLGGGSSDAATTLVVLNRLWELGLDRGRLAALGLQLGADVPVFVYGQAAWAEGVGELLTPVEVPEPWYLVVHPGCAVATGEVFNDPQLTRNSSPITIEGFTSGAASNDFEAVVCRHYPPVAAALEWLRGHGRARLTGTGSCVFLDIGERERAAALLVQLPDAWTGFVARGCNRSPLLVAESGF